jgi:hypothetical protein
LCDKHRAEGKLSEELHTRVGKSEERRTKG